MCRALSALGGFIGGGSSLPGWILPPSRHWSCFAGHYYRLFRPSGIGLQFLLLWWPTRRFVQPCWTPCRRPRRHVPDPAREQTALGCLPAPCPLIVRQASFRVRLFPLPLDERQALFGPGGRHHHHHHHHLTVWVCRLRFRFCGVRGLLIWFDLRRQPSFKKRYK